MGRMRALLGREALAAEPDWPWYEAVESAARREGSMPYLVEGFVEVSEAVRRGHAVLLRREECEVADGVRVFAPRQVTLPPGSIDVAHGQLVTLTRFDLSTARFVVSDPADPVGAVQLTPKRLQRYLSEPTRCVGVALGV